MGRKRRFQTVKINFYFSISHSKVHYSIHANTKIPYHVYAVSCSHTLSYTYSIAYFNCIINVDVILLIEQLYVTYENV